MTMILVGYEDKGAIHLTNQKFWTPVYTPIYISDNLIFGR